MRRIAASLVVLAACAVAFALSAGGGAPQGGPSGYEVALDNAFGLVEGSDFKVGGVRAGRIETIALQTSPAAPPRAAVAVSVNEPGIELRADASCRVRLQSLIGEYFLDCQPGSSERRLPDGGRVPVERTEATIPMDLVNNVLRRPTRERLRLLLTSLGTGVAGRADDLRAVLRRAHPGLRETSRVLRILGDQQEVIDAFIRDADTVVSQLASNRRDVVRFVGEARATTEVAADRRDSLRAGIERLPGFLGELEPTMLRLGELAGRGAPLADGLRRAAPDLEGLLRELGPFAEEALPALGALGGAAVPATGALRAGRAEVRQLAALARDAPGLARPLRQLLDSLDDRSRAVEDDTRARRSGPPAPDPTHTDGPEGFTGFEAIANYAFWQSLSTNGFDSLGHLLRVPAVFDPDCSPFTNRSMTDAEDARVYAQCNSWLGPQQPGLNAPDPSSVSAAGLRAQSRRPARRIGERRGPGEPDAGPLPGQHDPSQPQIVLPPGVGELLDGVDGLPDRRPPGLPGAPDLGGGSPGGERSLLDFLLGP